MYTLVIGDQNGSVSDSDKKFISYDMESFLIMLRAQRWETEEQKDSTNYLFI